MLLFFELSENRFVCIKIKTKNEKMFKIKPMKLK